MTTVQPAPLTGAELARMRERSNAVLEEYERLRTGPDRKFRLARDQARLLDELERTREAVIGLLEFIEASAEYVSPEESAELLASDAVLAGRSVLPPEEGR